MQGNQDASAVLLVDGRLVFAQEEERFTRLKHAVGALPENAISAALGYANLTMKDIDLVAFHTEYASFGEKLERYLVHLFGHCPALRFVNHHKAHAASAYYASGFEDAMVFTTDLSGDGISTTLSHGVGADIEEIRRYSKPQSLGIFYALVTQVLGFRRDSDEYKVMGMASYGSPTHDLSWLLRVEDGHYELDESYLPRVRKGATNPSKQEPMYSPAMLEKTGFVRRKGEAFTERHFDFASSAQHRLNDAAVSLVRWLHQRTGSRRLCVAGGVGLNCVMNQALLAMPEIDELFVQPAASDAGTALGAAYVAAVQEGEKLQSFEHAYLGNEFTDDKIRDAIATLGVRCRETDDPAEEAARAISDGNIVGWFQGRHEYGPRALGARSILADPRREDMKDRINIRVKFREEFRPFAPSVLAERGGEYFDLAGELPYMTVTCNVGDGAKDSIPSVVHVDNTARVQTVNSRCSPLYHELISNVSSKTGVPVVLNTSYNVKGQPVVNTPTQAIGTLYGSGMDTAILGSFVLEKPK
jgi:carbamoyltransferase